MTSPGDRAQEVLSVTGLRVDAPSGDPIVEDVSLSNVRFEYAGGGTLEEAARQVPENRDAYPEPSMFGVLPVSGLFIRHARDIRIDGLELTTAAPDARPPVLVESAQDIAFTGLKASAAPVLKNCRNVTFG